MMITNMVMNAVEQALHRRILPKNLNDHSDKSIQYFSGCSHT